MVVVDAKRLVGVAGVVVAVAVVVAVVAVALVLVVAVEAAAGRRGVAANGSGKE